MKLLFLTHAATAPAINSAPRFTQRCLVPESFTPTERTRVVREPHRGVYDRQEIYKILDEGIVCHVGFIADAQPFVIPTLYARGRRDLFSWLRRAGCCAARRLAFSCA